MPIPLEPGHMLRERYLVRQIIGRGGMGSIYLAEDSRLPGRLCALKEVDQDPSLPQKLRDQSREQFYQEASVLARLDQPNLPKVSDFFSDGSRGYLVMDYVPGDDLKTLMDAARRRGQTLPVADVLGWASQLADALEFLHAQTPPVIHRDIKPSNLKLMPSGLLKLVDFGLVKQMAPDEMTVTVIQGRGTALYTPLEQYGGDDGHTDPRTDIYAFGATLYHLLTNQPPVEAKQRFLRPDSLRSPAELVPDLDPRVVEAVLWAMELHPDQRPQSVAEFRQALLGNMPSIRRPGGRYEPPKSPGQWLENPLDQLLAGSILLLLLIAVIASLT
jgi:serine/threonine protein kinase